jgi:hypothetical protein
LKDLGTCHECGEPLLVEVVARHDKRVLGTVCVGCGYETGDRLLLKQVLPRLKRQLSR